MPETLFWESATPRVELAQVEGWTLPSILQERAQREPNQSVYAVPDGDQYRPVSWGAFGAMAAEIAAGLRLAGFLRRDRAAIMGEPTVEWVASDFGSLGAGGISVGIYQTDSWQEVAYIIGDCTPSVFFAQRSEHLQRGLQAGDAHNCLRLYVLMEGEIDGMAAPTNGRLMTLAELRRTGAEALASDPGLTGRLLAEGGSTDLARIIYTSGTTGRPKGVMYTHQAWLLVGEQWVLRYPPIRQRQHASVAFLSTAHVTSAIATEVVPLVSKLQPHFAPPGSDLLDVFRRVRPEVLGMTPRFYQKIAVQLAVSQKEASPALRALHQFAMKIGRRAVHRRWDRQPVARWMNALLWLMRRTLFRRLRATVGLDRLERAQTGSAMMPVDVATVWAVWGLDIREAYGLSEAACAVAYQQNAFPRPGTIGRSMTPQPGTELELAPDGEILFKSPMVFSGYWNAPEATAKALQDGWFHTGDLAEWTAEGDLRLVGRKNEAISTSGGKTINPSEIEAEVKASPYISEVIVFGHGEKYLTALIELELAQVQAWAKDKITGNSDYAAFARNEAVLALIKREVTAANDRFGRVHQIKQFRIIPEPLDSVPGALTTAKKIKRRVVREHFHVLVESMYDRSEDAVLAANIQAR